MSLFIKGSNRSLPKPHGAVKHPVCYIYRPMVLKLPTCEVKTLLPLLCGEFICCTLLPVHLMALSVPTIRSR